MRILGLRPVLFVAAIGIAIALFSLGTGPRTTYADATFDPDITQSFCNTLPSDFFDTDLLPFSGTADSFNGAKTIMTDAAGGFGAVNSLVGAQITLYLAAGGADPNRNITANTATTVTVGVAFSGTAAADDVYAIGNKDQVCLAGAGANAALKENVTPGAAMTVGTSLNIDSGDLNFSNWTTFLPTSMTITPGCNIDLNNDGSLDNRVFIDDITISGDATGGSTTTLVDSTAPPFGADDAQIGNVVTIKAGPGVGQSRSITDSTSTTLTVSPVWTAPTASSDYDVFDTTTSTCLEPGDRVGGLMSQPTLGLSNAICNNSPNVPFLFQNVALPNVAGNPRASTNVFTPPAEGSDDRYANSDEGAAKLGAKDVDLDSHADGDSNAIQKYPDMFLDLYDPDWEAISPPVEGPDSDTAPANANNGALKPVVPLAMYGGLTRVPSGYVGDNPNGDFIPLYFTVFRAGDLVDPNQDSNTSDGFASPHIFSSFTSPLGQATSTQLTDTTTVVASVSSTVTDFCSKLVSSSMLLGTTEDNGDVRASNPGAGTHRSATYAASNRDLDNDSYDNAIDSCPTAANIDGDPRSEDGADNDMLDSACDPNNAVENDDQDGDCPVGCTTLKNGGDNCPLVGNGTPPTDPDGDGQKQTETTSTGAAPDGGPGDAIGDVCDSEEGTIKVAQNVTGLTSAQCEGGSPPATCTSITMSDSVSNGRYFTKAFDLPKCFGSPPVDVDNDGYCAADESDDNNALDRPSREMSPPDQDGDGWSVWVETYQGTDDTKDCSATTDGDDEPIDSFAADYNDDQFNDITDISLMGPPVFNILQPAGVNGSYNKRMDQNADSFIDITDVSLIGPPIFSILTPCTQGGPTAQQ